MGLKDAGSPYVNFPPIWTTSTSRPERNPLQAESCFLTVLGGIFGFRLLGRVPHDFRNSRHFLGGSPWTNFEPRYCGRYKFDKKEGFGILTEASGEVRQGFWVNGDFLD